MGGQERKRSDELLGLSSGDARSAIAVALPVASEYDGKVRIEYDPWDPADGTGRCTTIDLMTNARCRVETTYA